MTVLKQHLISFMTIQKKILKHFLLISLVILPLANSYNIFEYLKTEFCAKFTISVPGDLLEIASCMANSADPDQNAPERAV